MSEFSDILNGVINVKIPSAFILDETTPGLTMAFDRQPGSSCRMEIYVAGATINVGSATIAGDVSETIDIPSNGAFVGIKDFATVSGLTLGGIQGGKIKIRAVNASGEPINQEITRHTNLPVYFFAKTGKIVMGPAGQEKIAEYTILAEADKQIVENDIIYAVSGISGLTRGQVAFARSIMDFDGLTHHNEADIVPL